MARQRLEGRREACSRRGDERRRRIPDNRRECHQPPWAPRLCGVWRPTERDRASTKDLSASCGPPWARKVDVIQGGRRADFLPPLSALENRSSCVTPPDPAPP